MNQKKQYWAIRCGSQIRLTTDRVSSPEEAAWNCLESTGGDLQAKPLGPRKSQLQSPRWLRSQLDSADGWVPVTRMPIRWRPQ